MKLGRRLGKHVNRENVGTDTKGWENVGRKGGKIASPSVRPNYLRAVISRTLFFCLLVAGKMPRSRPN